MPSYEIEEHDPKSAPADRSALGKVAYVSKKLLYATGAGAHAASSLARSRRHIIFL